MNNSNELMIQVIRMCNIISNDQELGQAIRKLIEELNKLK